jgi:hypothetical protein
MLNAGRVVPVFLVAFASMAASLAAAAAPGAPPGQGTLHVGAASRSVLPLVAGNLD